jgi:hypothetical protein
MPNLSLSENSIGDWKRQPPETLPYAAAAASRFQLKLQQYISLLSETHGKLGGSQETHGSLGSHKDPWRISRKRKSLEYEVMMMETHLNVLW